MSLASPSFAGLLALSIVATSPLRAQGAGGSAANITPFSTVFFSTGTLLMDVSKLNPHFERTDIANPANRPGYFTISNDGFAIGLGGYGAVFDRVAIGGEWQSADIGEEASPSGKTNAMTTSYLAGTIGYAVFTSWRVNVIPSLGLGAGTVHLTLKDRNGGAGVGNAQDPTFDDILANPGAESVIKGSYVILLPAIGVDFLILRSDRDKVGLTLGLHFASPIAPNRTTWTYQGRSVFGGPDVGPSGGSLRLVAGIGGFRIR